MKFIKLQTVIIILSLSISSHAQLAGVYTIGKNGNEDFSSFTAAIYALFSNGIGNTVTFRVSDGIYEEQLYIPYIVNATLYSPVIFESASGDSTGVIISSKPTDPLDNATLFLDNAGHVYFRKMTFTTDTISGRLVELGRNCINLHFENCVFKGMRGGAELFYSPCQDGQINAYLFIKNNRFELGNKGVSLCSNTSLYDSYIYIQDNLFLNQSVNAISIKYLNAPEITGNLIYQHHEYDNYHGLRVESCSYKTKISENKFFLSNTGLNNIALKFTKTGGTLNNEALIANNFFYINTVTWAAGIDLTNSGLTNIYFNSFNITGDAEGSTALSFILSSDVIFRNNIFSNKAGGLCVIKSSSQYMTFNNNLFYTTGPLIANMENVSITDIKLWQDSTQQGIGSFTLDPMYCSDSNLHTYNDSLSGKGMKITEITKDIDGEVRADKPVVGADEFKPFHFKLGNDKSICAYDSISIDAGNGFDSYLWHDSSSFQTNKIIPSANKHDSVNVMVRVEKKGCYFTDSLIIHIDPYPVFHLGDDTIICKNYVDSFTVLGPSGFAEYVWQDNSSLEYFTMYNLNDKNTGDYLIWLKATTDKGCHNTDSMILRLELCGDVPDLDNDQICIFPNPAEDIIQITVNNHDLINSSIYIYSVNGKLIKKTILNHDNTIDIHDLIPTCYYIIIDIKSKLLHGKFLKY